MTAQEMIRELEQFPPEMEVRLAQPPKKEVGELIRKAHQELKFPIGQGFTDALKEYHQMNAPEE